VERRVQAITAIGTGVASITARFDGWEPSNTQVVPGSRRLTVRAALFDG